MSITYSTKPVDHSFRVDRRAIIAKHNQRLTSMHDMTFDEKVMHAIGTLQLMIDDIRTDISKVKTNITTQRSVDIDSELTQMIESMNESKNEYATQKQVNESIMTLINEQNDLQQQTNKSLQTVVNELKNNQSVTNQTLITFENDLSLTNDKLQQIVDDKSIINKTISQFVNDLQNLTNSLTNNNNEQSKLFSMFSDVAIKQTETNDTISQFENNLAEMTESITNIKNDLSLTNKTVDDLSQLIDNNKSKLTLLANVLDEKHLFVTSKINDNEQFITFLNDEISRLKELFADEKHLKNELLTIELNVNKNTNMIDELRRNIDLWEDSTGKIKEYFDNEFKNSSESISKVSNDLLLTNDSLTNVKNDLSITDKSLTKTINELALTKQYISDCEQQYCHDLSITNQSIDKLLDELSSTNQSVVKVDNDLSLTNKNIDKHTNDISLLNNSITKLNSDLSLMNESLTDKFAKDMLLTNQSILKLNDKFDNELSLTTQTINEKLTNELSLTTQTINDLSLRLNSLTNKFEEHIIPPNELDILVANSCQLFGIPVDNISEFKIGQPVYMSADGFIYSEHSFKNINELESRTQLMNTKIYPALTTSGNWKEYIGICTNVDTKLNIIKYANKGSYIITNIPDTSNLGIGETLFIDPEGRIKIVADNATITTKMNRIVLGIITFIIDEHTVQVYK